jgi:hypothetical protein
VSENVIPFHSKPYLATLIYIILQNEIQQTYKHDKTKQKLTDKTYNKYNEKEKKRKKETIYVKKTSISCCVRLSSCILKVAPFALATCTKVKREIQTTKRGRIP